MAIRWPEQRLTPGRLVYLAYHRPRGFLKKTLRAGVLNTWRTEQGRRAMERAAATLEPIRATPEQFAAAHEVTFLTGARFWYQTAFCAWTLAQHAGQPFRLNLLDDGSLGPEHRAALERVFPGAVQVETRREAEARLDQLLPKDRYPTLRTRRLTYPNLRKLTDLHAGRTGWKFVLDSDMLFFRRPDVLLEWLRDSQGRPLHMVDVEESYGYPRATLEELAGAPLAHRLNVGIVGIKSEEIDWDQVEHWNTELIRRHGSSYFEEQALCAMMMAGRECAVAPRKDYICLPTPGEVEAVRAILHHYVADSKPAYFRTCWRKALEMAPPMSSLG